MEVICVMLLGVWVGNRLFSEKHKNSVEKIQFTCIVALIFLMGVSLGNTEGFLEELVSMGFISMIYAIVPILVSTILVFIVTNKVFINKEDEE